jgi:hypothetical protein
MDVMIAVLLRRERFIVGLEDKKITNKSKEGLKSTLYHELPFISFISILEQ